jgi:two-component sensor histidine kinase
VKYGALSLPDGRIEISWEMFTHPEDGPYFRMHWRESGGPAVVAPSRQGFGHVIIAQMTSRALRGDVIYAFEPAGLEWTLEAPLDSIEEQTDMPFMAKI